MKVLVACKDYSYDDLKQANKAAGHHWFDEDTMLFFKSRLLDIPHTGAGYWTFATSEQPPYGKRVYSVRICYVNGHIETVDTAYYSGSKQAVRWAKKYATNFQELPKNIQEKIMKVERV